MSAAKLGVLVVHGIGSQPSDFAREFQRKVAAQLEERGHSADELAWMPVHWAPILQQREDELLQRMERGGELGWATLRRFVVHGLADALAYQPAPETHTRHDVYQIIHRRFRRDVRALRRLLRNGRPPDAPDPPVVVVAHSLGCHMVSNFIWDARKSSAESAFARMETIAGIVFLGCNIPLFSLAHKHFRPIDFPHADLARAFPPDTDPGHLRRVARWLNLYDPDDVLGWPLRTLSDDYALSVVEDVPVNAGGLLWSWNPKSHTEYWGDDSVVTLVAEVVEDLLHLL